MKKTPNIINPVIFEDVLDGFKSRGFGLNEYQKMIEKSKPEPESLVSINTIAAYEDMFFNFSIHTDKAQGYFRICPALGDTNDLWHFLEDIASGAKRSVFISDQEGPLSVLTAYDQGNGKIRLILISNEWLVPAWNKETQEWHFITYQFADRSMHINMDIVVDKRMFVFNFYGELRDVFVDNDDEPRGIKRGAVTDEELAQSDSDIIKGYLGFSAAKPLDTQLYEHLQKLPLNVNKIKELLNNGANPNAMVDDHLWNTTTITNAFNANYFIHIADQDKNINHISATTIARSYVDAYKEVFELLLEHGALPELWHCLMPNMPMQPEEWLEFVTDLLNRNLRVESFAYEDIFYNCDIYTVSCINPGEIPTEYYEKLINLLDERAIDEPHIHKTLKDFVFEQEKAVIEPIKQ